MLFSVCRKRVPLIYILYTIPLWVVCQREPIQKSVSDFEILLKNMHNESDMHHASFSVSVYDLEKELPIIKYNAEQSLTTGSVLKVLTTSSALQILGNEFKFQTSLAFEGKLIDKTLEGNLYILGGGDPTLGPDEKSMATLISHWIKKIQHLGIQKITGKIIGYGGLFEKQLTPDTWTWKNMGNWYSAGPCGLSIHQNTYSLYFKPAQKVGNIAQVLHTEPSIPFLQFINEMKTGKTGSGDNGYIYGTHHTFVKYLRGTIPAGKKAFAIKGAIPDPAFFAAYTLHHALLSNKIQIKPAPRK